MGWIFDTKHAVTEYMFNKVVTTFFAMGVGGLVRENIQNSLDARISNDKPVIIKIKMGSHKRNDIPGFYELEQRIRSLSQGNNYSKDIINEMKENLTKDEFNYLEFEDENTKGLSGAKFGFPNLELKGSYNAYAYAKGQHFDDHDENFESQRGGSHGIGKIASNSASIFHLMFFCNCDENNYQTIGGNIQLIDHYYGGVAYSSTGDFVNKIDNKYFPIENKDFNVIFHKRTRGLKIVIPFLRKDFFDKQEIINTVLDSFLLAIMNDKLIVEIEDQIISSETLDTFIQNREYSDEENRYFTKEYYKTYIHGIKKELKFNLGEREFIFKLMIRIDENLSEGYTAVFRQIGMKIEDRKLQRYNQLPYNAVLISASNETDQMLKILENESHTKLDYKTIRNDSLKQLGKKFQENINRLLRAEIDKLITKIHEEDENIDLSDVLYEIEKDVRKDLSKKISLINIGGKEGKKIIKVNPTDEEGDSIGKTGKRRGQKGDFPFKRVKKDFGDTAIKSYYEIPNSRINRIVSNSTEFLSIKVDGIPNVNERTCDILVSLIDGMGDEIIKDLNLLDLYSSANDINNKKDLVITKNSIKNIKVVNNSLKVEMVILNDKSYYYKFRYYLEV